MIIPFFPRNSGPLVSILIPTRGRSQHLCVAVDSFYSLAKDKSLLEFVFKVDDDDLPTIDTVKKISELIPSCKVLISPRGRGYLDMHKWVNQMCETSSGQWLFLANDDVKMVKDAWDQILLGVGTAQSWPGIDELCLLVFPTVGRPDAQEFLALRRGTFDLLGHFSILPHNDTWINGIMNFCGCVLHVPIFVEHYSDQVIDDIRREGHETHKITGRELTSISTKRFKMLDVKKIVDRMAWYESRRVWRSLPKGEGWMLWKDTNNLVHTVVVQGELVAFFKNGMVEEVKKVKEVGGVWTRKE